MVKKSDKLPTSERTVTATEASRSFSEILDEVEAGARIRVVRHGREVCVIMSAPPELRRRTISEILASLEGKPEVTLDDKFGEDMKAILSRRRPRRKRPVWD